MNAQPSRGLRGSQCNPLAKIRSRSGGPGEIPRLVGHEGAMPFSPAAAASVWRVLQIRKRWRLAAAQRRLLDIKRDQQQQLQLATAVILAGAQKGAYGRRVVKRNNGGWQLSTINSYLENSARRPRRPRERYDHAH